MWALCHAARSLTSLSRFATMGSVQDSISQKRMTETLAGRAAALLLALIWLASMGMTDVNAYSFLPTLAGLVTVILLALSALIRGARAVRLSKTAWASLAVGVYYLVRSLCSFDVVSSWREASLILSCGVFYVAGVYAAQGRSLRPVVGVLLAGVLLNMVYFYLMQHTDVPMEWSGRPAVGPGGENHRPVTLFVYKNQAGAFLMAGGILLAAAALWGGVRKRLSQFCLAVVGVGAVVLSDNCGTRAVLLLAPFMVAIAWVLWVALKLHETEKISVGVILSGFVILGGIGVGVCSLFFEPQMASWVMGIDSHARYHIWGECCRYLRESAWFGHGASSVQWVLAPSLDGLTVLANYAHNEYLQVWLDYGSVGIAGMLFIIFSHLVRGGVVLMSEQTGRTQKTIVALAFLCFSGWTVASFVDFIWHHVALASMSAFCAGVLSSPYAYMRRGTVHRVQAQGACGKGLLALLGTGVIGLCAWLGLQFYPAWVQQWEFNRLSSSAGDEDGAQRLSILNSLLPQYPSYRLVDTAYTLPCAEMWAEEEKMLLLVLDSNPRQYFMAGMLARLATANGCYRKAESIYRNRYPGDGIPRLQNRPWPASYLLNLFLWGQHCMFQGDMPGAYSRMAYAVNILDNAQINFVHVASATHNAWEPTNKELGFWFRYLAARRQDVELMKNLGIEPDDSWIQPMEPGGKPALYRRYGLADKAEREAVAEEERRAGRLRGENP